MAVSDKMTKVSENMTRSQKNRQRKAKRSSIQAKLPNLPPYRLSTILAGGSRHSSVIIDKWLTIKQMSFHCIHYP